MDVKTTSEEDRDPRLHLRERDRRIAELESRLASAEAFLTTVQDMLTDPEKPSPLRAVLDRAIDMFELADGGIIAVADRVDPTRLRVAAASPAHRPEVLRVRPGHADGAPGFVYNCGRSMLWADEDACATILETVHDVDRSCFAEADKRNPPRQSIICAPLIVRGAPIGAVQLEHFSDGRRFTDDDLRALDTFVAIPLSAALDNTALRDGLRAREREAADLLSRMIAAREEERAHVARNLHDIMGQSLTSIGLALKVLEDSVTPTPENATLLDYLHEVQVDAKAASDTAHDLSMALHPAILKDLGLARAIEWSAHHMLVPVGVAVELDLRDVPPGMEQDQALTVFRVAQEAVTNIRKHAGATRVRISLRAAEGGCLLSVADNGHGFCQRAVKPSCLGLHGAAERARLAGGWMHISTAHGRGTTVELFVPAQRQVGT